MTPFAYAKPADIEQALGLAGPESRYIAGGTNLLDLMKENVARPRRLIDITGLPLRDIRRTPTGGLLVGALVSNAELAWNPAVEADYPLLAQAILAGASPQLRNMASTGGNLLQRTRCQYFYDTGTPCNKREPGSGCPARSGLNRNHAILGASEHCVAVHPSDLCVALAALEAQVLVRGRAGERRVAFADFHRLPADTPERDNCLAVDELVTAIELQALDRVDGPAKVTGQARYAAEYPAADLLHGSVVSSDVARGRVRGIDCAAALAVPGVVAVLHHLNRPPMAGDDEPYKDADAAEGEPFRPLFDDRVLYSGQPLALVLARSLELARYAGSLLRIDIEPEPHQTDLLAALDQAHEAPAELPAERGDFYTAYRAAPIRVEASYSTPIEHHNPMEPHASTVIVQPDGSLLVHDKTQGTQNSQAYLQKVFGLPADKVRVCAAYVGGAFGSGLRPQYQLALAVMAALQLRRSVRVVLTRQQMFTFGYRPRTLQRLQLGADAEGRLLALGHQATAQTSRFEDFTEHVVEWSGMLYRCENLSLAYRLVPLDVYTPLDMRAPGAALGLIGLECAMDELAVRLGMDPIALRRFNFAERNGNEDKPYSSKALLACYEEGARRFGWQARDPRPRSMSEGRQLLGWGMAGGVWEAMQSKASARARLEADGLLRVASATTDIGTGTYTVMTQIAADAAGMAPEEVRFQLGDSALPKAPLQGGSFTVSSVGSAVRLACLRLRQALVAHARARHPELAGTAEERFRICRGHLEAGDTRYALADLLQGLPEDALQVEVEAEPSARRKGYATATHSAVFVEVRIDEALGTLRVSRVVSAVAAGRVINPKTARSQILGGVVWGLGMALQEETQVDHALGRCMNHNLAEYHIPVNADIGDIEVIFVDEPDDIVNELGSKGVGEIGIVGVAAAVANAVYHATGRRLRDFPLTVDKLLG
ncbi:molybdopterin-dependent oxidoreductase [Pseudomonas aeruginosa]|nr:molybdopterin-dependent oxidoreductase [Pseudomonas aeruginosa]